MYLLYLDESGSVENSAEKHFVLAGIAVFERQAYRLQKGLDDLAATLGHPDPGSPEIHGSEIWAARKGKGKRKDSWWRQFTLEKRRAVIADGLKSAQSLYSIQRRLFGVVVDKNARSPEDPVEYAFAQICNRFDLFLRRLYHRGNPQRGLIVIDKSADETRLQSLASEFRTTGHRWGVMTNLVDVPFFVDSKATRGIQYADLVAYALWRKYERGDGEFFDVIANWFDREGGVVHGLHHYRGQNDLCDCPACVSRHA